LVGPVDAQKLVDFFGGGNLQIASCSGIVTSWNRRNILRFHAEGWTRESIALALDLTRATISKAISQQRAKAGFPPLKRSQLINLASRSERVRLSKERARVLVQERQARDRARQERDRARQERTARCDEIKDQRARRNQDVLRLYRNGHSTPELCAAFEISRSTVSLIITKARAARRRLAIPAPDASTAAVRWNKDNAPRLEGGANGGVRLV
jgi:DNA-binding NarL/FixJ family response regulator